VCQVNNLVTFSGKSIVSEEFLNRMVEALGITVDRRPKKSLIKGKAKPLRPTERFGKFIIRNN